MQTLRGRPVSPADARRTPEDGGLPDRPGFYAWWGASGTLPGVPDQPHPDPGIAYSLLYVGIAPNSATSKQTLRSRVVSNHMGGNIASSTFRFSLAALLLEAEGFEPTTTKTKFVLIPEDSRRLSDWQQVNLRLRWCEHPQPWQGALEAEVIAAMQPPMNLEENTAHPFHLTLSEARRRLRQAARRNAGH